MSHFDQCSMDALRSFFTNDLHNFPDTDQSTWLSFATDTAIRVQQILATPAADISLIELLQILSAKRADFAKKQPNLSEEKINQFGQWRDSVYGLNSEQVSIAMDRRIALNDALKSAGHETLSYQIRASICHTFYSDKNPLFNYILENLTLSQNLDKEQIQITPQVDKTTRKAINSIVNKKVKVSPSTFFDITQYQKYTLLSELSQSQHLTNFFVLTKPSPTFFVLIEHPTAQQINRLLSNELNEHFQELIKSNKKNNKSREEFITQLSDFMWYCHQLMPFERGSASIFLILTASLLQLANIPLKKYPNGRLDIDALSLTKTLFSQKFITSFS